MAETSGTTPYTGGEGIVNSEYLYETIQDLKENESQSLLLIKIIGDKGIDIEEIIDKWNEEVKKNQENESESSFLNNIDSTSNRINDSSFVPITIDEEKENKVKNSNVPKLNFNFLSAFSCMQICLN